MKVGSNIVLLPVEKVALVYCIFTSALMVGMAPRLVDAGSMLLMRVEWFVITAVLVLFARLYRRHSFLTTFLRTATQLGWLALWYPDTYEFNRCFDNLDHLFAAADQTLFGCQPAIVFSQLLPGTFWSEAFNLGYWSYFPMIILLVVTIFWKHGETKRIPAIIITAFFFYYAIYIFLPVAGPQFYFQAVGTDEILAGHFPALGTYFSFHTEMLPAPGNPNGLFYRLVQLAQDSGERPTAAFPSSHIGISTILLFLARRHAPRLLFILLPLWALLCCATVYIHAHYLVDAIAGFLSAPIVLWMASRLFTTNETNNTNSPINKEFV